MKIRFLVVLAFAIVVSAGNAQSVYQAEINKILKEPALKHATVGIVVADAKTGVPVFELNPHQLVIPASTMKLVTTATALELLGAGYRFETKIGYTGTIDESGVLNGNLVVVSGGDPTLGSAYFCQAGERTHFLDEWVAAVQRSGIKKITGKLVLDASVYETEEVPPTWVWGDIGNYYGAGANAFTVFDNLFTITFSSGKTGELTKIIGTDPSPAGLEIDNRVVAADSNSDQAYVYGSPMDKKRIIRGTIPKEQQAFSIKAAIPDPAAFFGNEMLKNLKTAGIEIDEFIIGGDTTAIKTITTHHSPALSDIVKIINHESVNLFAEHLLLQLSAGISTVATREESVNRLQQFWKERGLATSEIFMEDGSGLSHYNSVSPAFLTSVLVEMKKGKNSAVFAESLPVAGEGTLSSFSEVTFPAATLRAKSGSLTRVRCYAGYIKTESEKELAFTIMLNNFSGSQSKIRAEIEKLLREMMSIR